MIIFRIPNEDYSDLRDIARDDFVAHGTVSKPRMRKKITTRLSQYDSIIATIALSLAVRLVVALIMHWIENNVATPSQVYQRDEPGYTSFANASN